MKSLKWEEIGTKNPFPHTSTRHVTIRVTTAEKLKVTQERNFQRRNDGRQLQSGFSLNLPCVPKSEPLNILQQQPQICSDLNKILHTQDNLCYKHYYIVSYKSALTLLKYDFLNNTAGFAVCRPGRINLL